MVKNNITSSEEEFIELSKSEKKEIKQEVKEILKNTESSDPISQKVKPTMEDRVSNFFDTIEFLELENEEKESVATQIKQQIQSDKLYWIEIFLSSVIATLWLLQNSVAVVIWAMLIAPLLRPINALGFSIAVWWGKGFERAVKALLGSIIFAIVLSYWVTLLLGFEIETTEIMARSNPNVLDFFIAIFSAMVAVLSLRFTRLSESIAGVAMAASLMPPLAVVWIYLAFWNLYAAGSALMLFLANLFAIILVGTIFFWFYGFAPHDSKWQNSVMKRIWIVTALILLILAPLLTSFYSLKNNYVVSHQVEQFLENNDFMQNNFELQDINTQKKWDFIYIYIQIKAQEGKNITAILSLLEKQIYNQFDENIKIQFEIIRVFQL